MRMATIASKARLIMTDRSCDEAENLANIQKT
jgi:hypothetical protein